MSLTSPVVGTYGGTATLTATLNQWAGGGGPGLPDEQINFNMFMGSIDLGPGNTDANGVATLTGVSLSNISVGTYSDAVNANFDGTPAWASSGVSADLDVNQAMPTVTVTDAGGSYSGSAFTATALVAGVVTGVDDTPAPTLEDVAPTLAYYSGTYTSPADLSELNPLPDAPVDVGSYTVLASFAGSTDYTSASNLANFTITPVTPTITWSNPADIAYGTPLGDAQLDASTDVDGTLWRTRRAAG